MCELPHDWGATEKTFPFNGGSQFQGSSDPSCLTLLGKKCGVKIIHLGTSISSETLIPRKRHISFESS